MYVSRHVQFVENVFPYISLTASHTPFETTTPDEWCTLAFPLVTPLPATSSNAPVPNTGPSIGPFTVPTFVPSTPTPSNAPIPNTGPSTGPFTVPTSVPSTVPTPVFPSAPASVPSSVPSTVPTSFTYSAASSPHSPASSVFPIDSPLSASDSPLSSPTSGPSSPPSTTPPPPPPPPRHTMTTRLKNNIVVPNPKYASKKSAHTTSHPPTPTVPTSAIIALKNPLWHQAMTSEFDALTRNRTWTLVPPHPSQNVIGTEWVFRIKYKPDGTIVPIKPALWLKAFINELVSITLKPSAQSSNPPPFVSSCLLP